MGTAWLCDSDEVRRQRERFFAENGSQSIQSNNPYIENQNGKHKTKGVMGIHLSRKMGEEFLPQSGFLLVSLR
jgi:hypothetical protein